MKISQDFKCFIGSHRYIIDDKRDIMNPYDTIVGSTIICRCTNCGKIKENPIYTDTNYRRYTL